MLGPVLSQEFRVKLVNMDLPVQSMFAALSLIKISKSLISRTGFFVNLARSLPQNLVM